MSTQYWLGGKPYQGIGSDSSQTQWQDGQPFRFLSSGGNVKTVNAVAFASVKTLCGVAIAGVKTINGVAAN